MGNKSKQSGKRNKPKTHSEKSKSKTGAEANKSIALVQVAWIGLLGSLITAIIGLVGDLKPGVKLSSLTPEYCLELSKPVVQPDAKLPDGRCIVAPKIGITAECSNCLMEDAIEARCGKPRRHKEEEGLPSVPRDNVTVRRELEGRRLVMMLDSSTFINDQYRKTPHGFYRAEFTVFDPCVPTKSSKQTEFNYIYKENFKDLSRALSSRKKGFDNVSLDVGGLKIIKLTPEGSFIYAYLNQEFDFDTDFLHDRILHNGI